MGYKLELNTILSLPKSTIDPSTLEMGKRYTVEKPGERLFPLNIPIDLSDDEYEFYAKVAIRKLILTKGKTELEFEVLKIFNENESKVITQNFAKQA